MTLDFLVQEALKEDIQAQIILGNTYHLFLRPGMEVMEAAGGLHNFMNCAMEFGLSLMNFTNSSH